MAMIPTGYQIELCDSSGVQLIPRLDHYVSFVCSREKNNVGACKLVMPDQTTEQAAHSTTNVSWDKFKIDGIIRLMCSTNGGPMKAADETVYFIRKRERDLNAQGQTMTMTISGEDTITLLNRQTSTDAPDSTSVDKAAAAADDMLKGIFYQQFGVGLGWSSRVSIAPNLSLGASLPKKFPNTIILRAMQEIAQASTQAGTYLAFDMYSDGSSIQFRTYTGQRGVDRRSSTGNSLLIGPEAGNVLSAHWEEDYTGVGTYFIAGTQVVSDATLEGLGPFHRIVRRVSTSSANTTAQMLADAQAGLRAARPKNLFICEMIDTPGCQYDVHYSYGDFVTCQFQGQNYDCHLDAVTRTVQNGMAKITAIFRSIS
jgi:hypothetical protein